MSRIVTVFGRNSIVISRAEVDTIVSMSHDPATAELRKSNVLSLPGCCKIKAREKPAAKAGRKEIVGKLVMVMHTVARHMVLRRRIEFGRIQAASEVAVVQRLFLNGFNLLLCKGLTAAVT